MPIFGVLLDHICDACLLPNNEKEMQGRREGMYLEQQEVEEKENAETDRSKNVGMTDRRVREA